jgi:hypothetical protein
VTVTPEPAGANCALGGVEVQVGGSAPSYVCNGPSGASVDVVAEPAGSNCAAGGFAVSSGSGPTVYVCHGAAGSDGVTPTVTGEPAGSNCAAGGIAVQIGFSGAPSYVCNGAPGADGLSVVIADAGANCPSGGISVRLGAAGTASYVCNGTTPTITAEPAGSNCPAGGVKVQLGIQAPQYVCNGTSVVLDPCVSALYLPIKDPWGTTWDGSERGLTTFAAAKAACETIGGRLPLATEAFRVSAVRAGGVGETYDTNFLWTLDPVSATAQITGRMSDGTFTSTDPATVRPYRCLCPAATPAYFGATACNGPPGSACATLPGSGGRFAIDASDRAAIPFTAALWECSFVHAQLADSIQLIEAIPNGLLGIAAKACVTLGGHLASERDYVEAIRHFLPNGTGAWLHTSDLASGTYGLAVRWSGTYPPFTDQYPADATWQSAETAAPYRCTWTNELR